MSSGPIYDDGVRYCSSCKHYRLAVVDRVFMRPENGRCASKRQPDANVAISPGAAGERCAFLRAVDAYCGREGKWWEPE